MTTTAQIYDITLLRDGTKREGISLSCDDNLRILEGGDGTPSINQSAD